MKDSLGWRCKLGVVTPSVNTVIQPEYDAMRPPGVTNHIARMPMVDGHTDNDAGWHAVVRSIDEGLEPAVRSVMHALPDHLILGVSIEAVWGGAEGSRQIMERIAGLCPVGITTAAEAVPAALRALEVGPRIALLCPYRPPGVEAVKRFLAEAGYEVVRAHGMPHAKPSALASISKLQLCRELKALDGPDIAGVVQFGANVAMAAVAGEAERWLEKPVVAVNTAMYWHALRRCGIGDVVEGFGSLLERH